MARQSAASIIAAIFSLISIIAAILPLFGGVHDSLYKLYYLEVSFSRQLSSSSNTDSACTISRLMLQAFPRRQDPQIRYFTGISVLHSTQTMPTHH